MKNPGFSIKKINFKNGDNVELEKNRLTIITGPNNVGKSQALKEILGQLEYKACIGPHHPPALPPHSPQTKTHVVRSITCSQISPGNFTDWVKENFPPLKREGQSGYQAFGGRGSEFMPLSDIARHGIREAFLVARLLTRDRLTILEPTTRRDQGPGSYVELLSSSDPFVSIVSKKLMEAFGLELYQNFRAARIIFHLGKTFRPNTGEDRAHSDYVRRLEELPTLHDAGDGIKSFVACLLAGMLGPQPILIIDEPELFLHPPQARLMGKILANLAVCQEKQILVTSHSEAFVRGAMDSEESASLIRLTRLADVSTPTYLPYDNVKELWASPLLRSARAINGLFYKAVIIVEGDSDGRFYQALFEREANLEPEPADAAFITSGSKATLSQLAGVYKKLNVSTVAIADFDLLREEQTFKKLFEALGGNFEDVKRDFNIAQEALDNLEPHVSFARLVQELEAMIESGKTEGDFSTRQREKIFKLLNDTKRWSHPKNVGMECLAGEQYIACKQLLESCQGFGLFIVPVGELEGWERDLPAKNKKAWIRKALLRVSEVQESFPKARVFMKKIFTYLSPKNE